ncbi:MAG: RCC1 domain-containing protein [Comamonadaceae bacterium]|nr:RCC1 domain-containing protein [Comamonadaceae bacterium]
MKKIFVTLLAALVVFTAFPLGAKVLATTEATSSLPNLAIDFNLVPFRRQGHSSRTGKQSVRRVGAKRKKYFNGEGIAHLLPPRVISPLAFNLTGADKIIQLALGYDYSLALSQEGKVFSWTQATGRTDITSDFPTLLPTKSFQLPPEDSTPPRSPKMEISI